MMADKWKGRTAPIPLDLTQSTNLPGSSEGQQTVGDACLQDQRILSLPENIRLFIDSTRRLADRAQHGEDTIAFDKDDADTMDFVVASSNLRSYIYSIPPKSQFDIKGAFDFDILAYGLTIGVEIAGNIIPAIATTNAIIAGWIVLQALNTLATPNLRYKSRPCAIAIVRSDQRVFGSYYPLKPRPECAVCRNVYAVMTASLQSTTLKDVYDHLTGTEQYDAGEFIIMHDSRLLADADFDDNLSKTLYQLGLIDGSMLTVMDENERVVDLCLFIKEDASYVLHIQYACENLTCPSASSLQLTLPDIPNRAVPPQSQANESDDDLSDDIDIVAAPESVPPAKALNKRPLEDDAAETLSKKSRPDIIEIE